MWITGDLGGVWEDIDGIRAKSTPAAYRASWRMAEWLGSVVAAELPIPMVCRRYDDGIALRWSLDDMRTACIAFDAQGRVSVWLDHRLSMAIPWMDWLRHDPLVRALALWRLIAVLGEAHARAEALREVGDVEHG
jgi:hypothetical protein